MRLPGPDDILAATLLLIRDDMGLPESFAPEVEAEAREAAADPRLPNADLTQIPFVTVDPEGATDLDQALHIARLGDGYQVHYAIADVPAFVVPGGAVDSEARERGQTLYAPAGRIPLHPTAISEGAASLLPDVVRGAFVWSFELDAAAKVVSTSLVRARIRSRAQLSYAQVQEAIDTETADESLLLLREVGLLRIALEQQRGGASLNRPDEEVTVVDGAYTLIRRRPLPVEAWNAQLSLMTGMAAAQVMIDGGIGVLRTMPAPYESTINKFRRQAAALGCPWPTDQPYGEYLREIDQSDPRGLATIHAAASLFRGAGYTAFEGVPADTMQAAVAAPYAHATAPLRRLVDRFVLVTCEALLSATPVPEWVRTGLPTLPKIMARSDTRASMLERASVDAIEAALLGGFVGAQFDAVVISAKDGGGVIQLTQPVVTANIVGAVKAGQEVRATLITADMSTGTTLFRLTETPSGSDASGHVE